MSIAVLLTLCSGPSAAWSDPNTRPNPDEKRDGVNSALQFGTATAVALYGIIDAGIPSVPTGDRFVDLGNRIKKHHQGSIAAGNLVRAQTDFIGNVAIARGAVSPGFGTALALTGYGLKRTGDWIHTEIVAASERKISSMLATSWPESRATASELSKMRSEPLEQVLDQFKVGKDKLKDVLGENSDEWQMVKAQAGELLEQMTEATLRNTAHIKGTQEEIKGEIKRQGTQLTSFVKATRKHFEDVNKSLKEINAATSANAEATGKLAEAVAGNTKQAQAVARVMAMQWTPEQQLAAARSGALGLDSAQLQAFEKKIQAEIEQNERMQNLKEISGYLDSMNQIGRNLGVSKDVTNALGIAQIGLTSYLQVGTNPWAAAATLSNIASFGRPSAEAAASKAMYKYLNAQFEKVFAHLKEIKALQEETLRGIAEINDKLNRIQAQLNTLHDIASNTSTATQLLLREKLETCSPILDWFTPTLFPTPNELRAILPYPDRTSKIITCRDNLYNRLDSVLSVSSANSWSDTYLSLEQNKPQSSETRSSEFDEYVALEKAETALLAATKAFLRDYSAAKDIKPSEVWLTLAEPAATLEERLSKHERFRRMKNRFSDFDCAKPFLASFITSGICKGTTSPSLKLVMDRIGNKVAGPYTAYVIDISLLISNLSPLIYSEDETATFSKMVTWSEFESARQNFSLPLGVRKSHSQGRVQMVLDPISDIAVRYVVQQSALYGDFTANAVLETLWDDGRKALVYPGPTDSPLKAQAAALIVSNDVLARNVVLLALRRALLVPGTLPDAEIVATSTYSRGHKAFVSVDGCPVPNAEQDYMKKLLPNWRFVFRVTEQPTSPPSSATRPKCDIADPKQDLGAGVGVLFGSKFILAPTAEALNGGNLEQPAWLQLAIGRFAKVAEVNTLRQVWSLIPESSSKDAQFMLDLVGSGCLTGTCTPEAVPERN